MGWNPFKAVTDWIAPAIGGFLGGPLGAAFGGGLYSAITKRDNFIKNFATGGLLGGAGAAIGGAFQSSFAGHLGNLGKVAFAPLFHGIGAGALTHYATRGDDRSGPMVIDANQYSIAALPVGFSTSMLETSKLDALEVLERYEASSLMGNTLAEQIRRANASRHSSNRPGERSIDLGGRAPIVMGKRTKRRVG